MVPRCVRGVIRISSFYTKVRRKFRRVLSAIAASVWLEYHVLNAERGFEHHRRRLVLHLKSDLAVIFALLLAEIVNAATSNFFLLPPLYLCLEVCLIQSLK